MGMTIFVRENDLTPIGITDWRNQNIPFGVKDQDRLSHIYMVGKTGAGKTTLLLNMAASDIERGKGIAVIDPHGDLAEDLLNYVPQHRTKDAIYFNATDQDFPLAFNPLTASSPTEHHLRVSGLVSSFKKIWADSWGPRLEYILRIALLTLIQYPDATLLHLQPLLTNHFFRTEVLWHVNDPYLLSFWEAEYDQYSRTYRNEAIAPILNKVGVFASSVVLRNMVGQRTSAFRIKDLMDEEKILVVNLSKGVIGEDVSSILGSLLINEFYLASLARADRMFEERKPFYLYVDEVHSFVPVSFANILSEAKKFGLSLLLTHQYMDQLDEDIQSAIFGNVGTVISFRVGAGDAYVLAKEFHPVFTQDDFINLPRYAIYLKLMIDGATSKAFSATTLPVQKPKRSYKEEIIALNRKRFAEEHNIGPLSVKQVIPKVEKLMKLPTLF